MKIISFKKKNEVINKPTADIQKLPILVKRNLKINMLQIKKCWDIRDHCHYPGEYRGVGHDISNFKDSLPKEISIILDNGSNYDYHFIIEEIAEEFKKNKLLA